MLKNNPTRFLHRLQAALRAYRQASHNYSLPQAHDTPMGFKFTGNPTMENGQFEPYETALVKKLLPKNDLFINIGANIGYYCCWALKMNKRVIAFEPIEANVHMLQENITANHWDNQIELFPLALSDKTGISKIFGGGTGASLMKGWAGTPENNVVSIATTTLDHLHFEHRFANQQCFVLIDVEGTEAAVLKGAHRFLKNAIKPIWMIEITVTEHQPTGFNTHLLETFELFWNNGYEAWTADQSPRFIAQSEVVAVAKGGANTFNTHNFLFFEIGKKSSFLDT